MSEKLRPYVRWDGVEHVAVYPAMPGPTPMLAGKGKTEAEALLDLMGKALADPLAQCWNEFIEWRAHE